MIWKEGYSSAFSQSCFSLIGNFVPMREKQGCAARGKENNAFAFRSRAENPASRILLHNKLRKDAHSREKEICRERVLTLN